MSPFNEFSATLAQRGWREGGCVTSGWYGGHERKSLSCQQCLALVTQSRPFLLQRPRPTIHGVSLQTHLQEFGHQEFPGKMLGA